MKEFKEENLYFKIGLVIGAITGMFWCALIILEFIGGERASYINIIQTLVVGGLVLVTVGTACSKKLAGGILLVAESAVAIFIILYYGINNFPAYLELLLLPVPVFLAGLFFIIAHYKKMPGDKSKKPNKNVKTKKRKN